MRPCDQVLVNGMEMEVMCVADKKSPYKKELCRLFATLPSCKLGCRYDGWHWNSHQTMEWKSHFKKLWNEMRRKDDQRLLYTL